METNEKLEALKTFYAEMGDKNHFELLGVDQTADDATVRSAYFGLVKKYGADFFHNVTDEESKKAIDEVNRRLRQAYDAIGKESKRQEYIASLNGEAPQEEPEVDIAAVFEAEQATTQARGLMERGEFKVAIQRLEKAHSLDSKSLEAVVRLSYCRYMMMEVNAEGKRDPEAVKATKEELEANCEQLPNADYLRLFLGDIEQLEGNEDKAMKWYRAALKINPDNLQAKGKIKLAEDRKKRAQAPAQAPADSSGSGLDAIKESFANLIEKIKGLFNKN